MMEYENLKNKLENSKNININNISRYDIDDIENISINKNLDTNNRTLEFIKETKNPYAFMVDGMKVKIEYGETGLTAGQCIKRLIQNKINY